MDKNCLFIIGIIAVIIIICFIMNYKYSEHMTDVSTCPCNVNQEGKDIIGDCNCTPKCTQSAITGKCVNGGNTDMIKTDHSCPADRTFGIVPPLLVEPRIILTDNSMGCGALDNPHDVPSGYMDDEISKYDTNLEPVDRIYIDNSYSMSTMKTGLPPLVTRNMDTCLTNKVIKQCGNKIIK